MSCSVFDLGGCISGAVNTFLRTLVTDALNPMLTLLSDTLLTTPDPRSIPRLAQLWTGSWEILLASYGLLILVAGITLMAFETMQTRYSLREVAPRLLVGFLAGALSLTGAGMAIELANALSAAVLGARIGESDGATALGQLITSALTSDSGALFLLIMGLVMAGMLLAVLLTYVVRVALTIILVAGAPIALMLHALPLTEGIARWWWRTFGACLAIQVVQSLTLITALRVLLTPDSGFGLFGTGIDNGFITLLTVIALLYILFKIPFWLLSASRVSGGRSIIGSLVRGFIAYKTFGLLSGRRGGRPGGSGGGRGGPGRGGPGGRGGPRPPSGPPDPYARARATSGGQLALPLEGLLRRRPRPGLPTPPARPHRRPAGAGRQLALPLADGDWPENRPQLGADGQYRLPINARRTRPAPPPTPAPAGNPAGRGRQLEFTFDPYDRNRPLHGGQYPLPLEGVARRPRRQTSPAPPVPTGRATTPPAARTPRGRQLALPLTPPRGPTRPAQAPPAPTSPRRTPPRTPSARAPGPEPRRATGPAPQPGRPAAPPPDRQPPGSRQADPPMGAGLATPPAVGRPRGTPPDPDPPGTQPTDTTARTTPTPRPRSRPRPPSGDDPT